MAPRKAKLQLLLEGPDDLGVFWALFERYKIPRAEKNKREEGKISLDYIEGGGFEKLRSHLQVQLKAPDQDLVLGVIVDADSDLAARWDSLRAVLVESGYQHVPKLPTPEGVILRQEDHPAIGIWIMPDNMQSGMLEDFVRWLIPNADPLWNRAQRSVDEIPISERRFIDAHISKAYMHTWLAWQEEPGKPMGQAITKRFLDPDVPQAQLLITWLRTLFSV